MCGIAGIWGSELVEQDAQGRLDAMLKGMAHRGPDGQGTLTYRGGRAGMVRLALVDLSERGQQPIWSPDGKVAILLNGEMYNYAAERQRLAAGGYPFRSTSDTEVVLALYLERGLEFVHAVRGMFALAIFDFRNEPKMVLARDPFGIKPLLMASIAGKSDSVVFASELRALLASRLIVPDVDRRALNDYLTFGFVLQPRTLLSGVTSLPAGTLSVYQQGRPPMTHRFWTLPSPRPQATSYQDACGELRTILEGSVKLHASADVPVGVFLSGGVDSSAIAALMSQHHPSLRSYTLRLTDDAQDESKQAEPFAQRIGCAHTNVDVSDAEIAEHFPRFVAELDSPSNDGLNTWLISRRAAQDVKGVVSGLGGDEWFSGYRAAQRLLQLGTSSRAWLRSFAQSAHRKGPLLPGRRLKQRAHNLASRRSEIATWAAPHEVFHPEEIALMTTIEPPEVETTLQEAIAPHGTGIRPLDTACELDVYVYMGNQLLRDCDATSMASSLELRVPLVDVEICKFARACPEHFKTDASLPNPGKRILVDAVRDLLPKDIQQQPKRGFVLPYERWMEGPMSTMVKDLWAAPRLLQRGVLNALPKRFESLPPWPHRWTLVVLELWVRQVLDKVVPAL